jgi:flagellar FliL protein
MADIPLDQGRNGGRGAATEAASAPAGAAASAPAGMKAWLPLIITIVAMPALAFATTKFFLLPQMKKALAQDTGAAPAAADGAAAADSKDGAAPDPTKIKPKVKLPKILVNVAGTMGTRYLMTTLVLVGNSDQLQKKVDEDQDQLMDLATSSLSTKTISDLEKPGARNIIRAELMTTFNNALGGPYVNDIYIIEMAIQ